MQSKRKLIHAVVGICLCLQIVGPAGAQKPANTPTGPAIKVTTHLVVLTVVVSDKNGHPITNLNKDDFIVLENGQRQTVDTFEAPLKVPSGNEEAPAGSSEAVKGPGLVRAGEARTIIVLDELNTISEDTMFAAVKIQKYL